MIVHGGFDETSQCTDSLFALNLITFQWIECPPTAKGPGKIAHHSACLVLHGSRSINDYNVFFHVGKPKIRTGDPIIKYEGIYFFGGQNEKGFSENDLQILKIGRSPFEWVKPKTNGVSPCNRYGHSMHFAHFMNAIVIFGGRNDADLNSVYKNQVYLNDLWSLKMRDLSWVRIFY